MDTLVLDRSYIPVERVSWQRAITLYFQGKVEIVEEYEDREIRSVTFSFKVPSVVRFLKALRGKRRAIKFSRENVYTRDKGSCQYCGDKVTRAEFTYDHVLPKSRGGKTEWTNIVCACFDCNKKKSHKTPAEAGMKLRSVPERPKKLPDSFKLTLTWRPGDPDTWKQWLASVAYWHGELDE